MHVRRAGTDHVLALTRGGHVLSWGNGSMGQLGRVSAAVDRHDNAKQVQLTPTAVNILRTRGCAPAHILNLEI